MKITRKQLVCGILSIVILIASLALTLCDAIIPLNIWTHPVLTFLFSLSIGFGVMCFVLGIVKKSAWYIFLAGILLGLALIYVLSQYLKWWLVLISVIVFSLVLMVFCFIIASNKTESISLNKSSDYKTYEERRAQSEVKEAEVESEELPEIKSFK